MCPEDGSYPSQDEEDIIKWCASGLYAGAADTVSPVYFTFKISNLTFIYPKDGVSNDIFHDVDGSFSGGTNSCSKRN